MTYTEDSEGIVHIPKEELDGILSDAERLREELEDARSPLTDVYEDRERLREAGQEVLDAWHDGGAIRLEDAITKLSAALHPDRGDPHLNYLGDEGARPNPERGELGAGPFPNRKRDERRRKAAKIADRMLNPERGE